jgi:hypothetical protein
MGACSWLKVGSDPSASAAFGRNGQDAVFEFAGQQPASVGMDGKTFPIAAAFPGVGREGDGNGGLEAGGAVAWGQDDAEDVGVVFVADGV